MTCPLKGSGSCSGILSITLPGNLVSRVYLNRSEHFLAMQFQEVFTGEQILVLLWHTQAQPKQIVYLWKTGKCPAWAQGELMGRDSVQLAYWACGRHRAIYRMGLPRAGFQRWCMQCHHTAHTICQKFQMTCLTSHTGQCLLAEVSTDIPWPVIAKQCYLWRHNQGGRPWQRAHQYLLVLKGQPYIVGQFSPLHM